MSDAADVVVVKGYLKWTPKMKLYLVKAAKVNRAHIKTKTLQFQEKYVKVIADLWSRKEFNEQCEKQTWTTVQKIFRTLCDTFSATHGYGENGMRVNLIATHELTEMDELLHDMCKEIASQIEETDQEKKVKTEKKKVVADITEVIQSGGGKSGLAKLASEMKCTGDAYLSGKTDSFVKGFTESCSSTAKTASTDVKSEITVKNISAVTAESSTRKRKLSRTECEGEDLMRTFSDQFLREDQAEAERMRNVEETIRVSGEATAAAIAAGNEETARANRALFAMLSSLLGSK
jgi:hypothetical protein